MGANTGPDDLSNTLSYQRKPAIGVTGIEAPAWQAPCTCRSARNQRCFGAQTIGQGRGCWHGGLRRQRSISRLQMLDGVGSPYLKPLKSGAQHRLLEPLHTDEGRLRRCAGLSRSRENGTHETGNSTTHSRLRCGEAARESSLGTDGEQRPLATALVAPVSVSSGIQFHVQTQSKQRTTSVFRTRLTERVIACRG